MYILISRSRNYWTRSTAYSKRGRSIPASCFFPILSHSNAHRLTSDFPLELSSHLWYIISIKRQPPTRWVDLKDEIEKSTPYSVKVLGWFFYVELLTKRKNECKQCQKEYAKSQQILKIKIILIFHSITPILSRIEVNATLQHGCHVVFYHILLYSTIFISCVSFRLSV